ncbi:DUF6074 family protein [Ancylobacter oerskovii]|uniref:DUF6074 family protein n=1 Tax=Ancylobacter oerskovii TaxID=459519 RepID=A0ABW4Z4C8_9HYPH|nr:DUF6074 family protein [Ancylobacter oerskovii]MBS7545719.1 hypothetical protein [Ancylobacter oerskovii]
MTQRSAIIIPFPAAKRTGRIQRVAEILSSQHTKRGVEAYWRRTVNDMRRSMEKAGLEPEIIAREVEDFRRAVGAAMVQGATA